MLLGRYYGASPEQSVVNVPITIYTCVGMAGQQCLIWLYLGKLLLS